jgi:anti-sigma regulatory factor (Ser/Thr protein kinase)
MSNTAVVVNHSALIGEGINDRVASDYANPKVSNRTPVLAATYGPNDLTNKEAFTSSELRPVLNEALAQCSITGIEVVSASPEWIELGVPCSLAAIALLQELLMQLDADLPPAMGEAISYAFREMFSNAVEYGGRLDPTKHIEVRFVRLKRAIICRIKDPGDGFDPTKLNHSAINNPNDDPLRHVSIREEKGLRAGGFGILLTNQLVDELVYNEQHNEVLFVKYVS